MTAIEKLESNIAEVNSAFQNIKNKIAEKGVEVDVELKPIDYAEKVAEVYEAGKKAEYDAFWDSQKTNFESAASQAYWFAGGGWDNTTFNPNFDIIPTQMATGLFRRNAYNGDLVALAERNGIVIDFSKTADVTYLFYEASFTRIGVLDFRNAPNLTAILGYAYYLQTIDKIILYENNTFNNVSFRCPSLVNVIFEGVIGQNGLNLQWSTKLSKASIESIINHLSTTTSGLTVTLSQEAVNNAFTAEEWAALIATRTNWTISLV